MYEENEMNFQRLFKHIKWKFNLENLQEFHERMQEISPEAKKIIETRWGLELNTKMCPNYKILDKKLGIQNSKEAYELAIDEFRTIRFAKLLVDREKFHPRQAANIGMLADSIFFDPDEKENSIIGQELLECLKELPERTQRFISMRFGLEENYKHMSLSQVAFSMGMSISKAKSIEFAAIRKLHYPHLANKFVVFCKEEFEAELKDRELHPENYVPIIFLNLSPYYNDKLYLSNIRYVSELSKIDYVKLIRMFSYNDSLALIKKAKEFNYQTYLKKIEEIKTKVKFIANDIHELKLGTEICNCLRKVGVNTGLDFLLLTDRQVRLIRGIGAQSYGRILQLRQNLGFPLK